MQSLFKAVDMGPNNATLEQIEETLRRVGQRVGLGDLNDPSLAIPDDLPPAAPPTEVDAFYTQRYMSGKYVPTVIAFACLAVSLPFKALYGYSLVPLR